MKQSYHSARWLSAACLIVGLILCPLAVTAAPAGQDAGTWTVRGFGAWVGTTGDALRSGPPIDNFAPVVEFSLTLDDGTGAGLALEYRATRRLGIEALAVLADLDADFRLRVFDQGVSVSQETRDLSTDILGLGLNLHLTPQRRIDVYAGPLVALVRYGDVTADFAGGEFIILADFEDDTAFGVTLGADIALGSSGRWACSLALRRLWSSAKVADSIFEVDVDPLIASAGLAYRWGGR